MKDTINRTRPIASGSRTYTGKTVPAQIAAAYDQLSRKARAARDPVTRAFYLGRRNQLLRGL